jgi:putative Mn2+ efflux pump MntP
MDSFAVSVGMGTKHSRKNVFLGFYLGIYFAIFHVFMLFIGHVTGLGLYQWIAPYANLLSCVLLVFLGGKAIYGSYFDQADELDTDVTHKVMLLLAFITSIDAMAAGFSLTLFDISVFIAGFVIAAVVFLFSWIGVFIGTKSGTYLAGKAEIFGGIVLILVGFKILLV